MNFKELKRLTELLKRIRELKRLTAALKNIHQVREHPETREWFEKNHDFFAGLSPQDWAWLKEKVDYDEKAWKEITAALQSKEGEPS